MGALVSSSAASEKIPINEYVTMSGADLPNRLLIGYAAKAPQT